MSWCSTRVDNPPPEYKIGLQITYYNKSLETPEDNKKSSGPLKSVRGPYKDNAHLTAQDARLSKNRCEDDLYVFRDSRLAKIRCETADILDADNLLHLLRTGGNFNEDDVSSAVNDLIGEENF